MRIVMLALLVGSSWCSAQHLGFALPEERIEKPKFTSERQRKLDASPLEMFRDVAGSDVSARSRALGMLLARNPAEMGMETPPDISIRFVNLDEDADPECVIQVNLPFVLGSGLLIAEHKRDGWYSLDSKFPAGVRKFRSGAPGDPIMPVSDSFGHGFVGIDGGELR